MSKAHRVGAAEDILAEQLEGQRRRRTVPAEEQRDQIVPAASPWPRQKCKGLLIASGRQCVEARYEICQRLVPRDFLELPAPARAASLERMREPIRVIRNLNGGLPARTQPPLIDRMRRIAFELLRHAHLDDALLAVASDLHVG